MYAWLIWGLGRIRSSQVEPNVVIPEGEDRVKHNQPEHNIIRKHTPHVMTLKYFVACTGSGVNYG